MGGCNQLSLSEKCLGAVTEDKKFRYERQSRHQVHKLLPYGAAVLFVVMVLNSRFIRCTKI